MAALTIRNVKDETKQALRLRAARRGASMEDEARSILRAVVEADLSLEELSRHRDASSESAWDAIRALRDRYGTFELELPKRTAIAGERKLFDDE